MADYNLLESFGIDDGELSGLSLVEAFVLGVEWQMFYQAIQQHRSDITTVHSANVDRLIRMLQHHRLRWVARQLDDTWTALEWSHDAD